MRMRPPECVDCPVPLAEGHGQLVVPGGEEALNPGVAIVIGKDRTPTKEEIMDTGTNETF